MLPPRPLTRSFKIALRCDPALDVERFKVHADPDAADATAAAAQAKKASAEAFDAAYRRAVETLDFAPISKVGQEPTFFVFKPLDGDAVARLVDKFGDVTLSDLGFEGVRLVLRASLLEIKNWPDGPKVEREPDSSLPAWGALASADTIDGIEDVAAKVMGAPYGAASGELASIVLMRSTLPDPK